MWLIMARAGELAGIIHSDAAIRELCSRRRLPLPLPLPLRREPWPEKRFTTALSGQLRRANSAGVALVRTQSAGFERW